MLIALGAVGMFDMAGSVALTIHFRHALRHEQISDRHEQAAHLIVGFGMLSVGIAGLTAASVRLVRGSTTSEPIGGIVIAAASVVALGYLGVRKRVTGARIPSPALRTDGWLSLTGAGSAGCALVGLALNKAFGWTWVDPAATMVIATTAIGLAIASLRSTHR